MIFIGTSGNVYGNGHLSKTVDEDTLERITESVRYGICNSKFGQFIHSNWSRIVVITDSDFTVLGVTIFTTADTILNIEFLLLTEENRGNGFGKEVLMGLLKNLDGVINTVDINIPGELESVISKVITYGFERWGPNADTGYEFLSLDVLGTEVN